VSTVAARLVTSPPARAVVPTLALQEAGRLMRHPLTVLGFAIYLVATGPTIVGDQGPRSAFETVNLVLTFYPGLLMILVGSVFATRDRRAGTGELLGPLPGRPEERLQAVVLASFAPVLIGLLLTVGLHLTYVARDLYARTPDGAPTVWHMLAGPVTLLGAALFGLMVGVWIPSRVTGVVALVAMVVLNVWLDAQEGLRLFGLALSWAKWGVYADDWAGLYAGSPMLHVAYLVSLCGMAAAAAWVRVADRRTAPVALGVVSLVAAVVAGIGQLP
jgi:hypothetical protein